MSTNKSTELDLVKVTENGVTLEALHIEASAVDAELIRTGTDSTFLFCW